MIFTLITPVIANTASQKMGFFETINPPTDISKHGHLIDWLFNYTTIMNLFFFILVCLGLFGFSFLYYRKRHPKAYYTHGTKKKHIALTAFIGLAVFVSIDMNITRMSNADYIGVFTKWPTTQEDVVRVEVMGQQWMWNFRYPGADGVFNT